MRQGDCVADYTPTPEDRFAFGMWTIGHPGRDPFGDSTRPAIDPVDYVKGLADIGAAEEQRQWQLRLLEREKKLLDKIDQALERLARGEYGWCAETGEPIGLKRLLLRPTATLCIEAKERQEQREKHQRDRD